MSLEPLLDPKFFVQRRLNEIEREFAWSKSIDEGWNERLTSRLSSVIGLDQLKKGELNLRVIGSEELDGYDQQTITFQTQKGLQAYGYLLVPDEIVGTVPAVVCVPGHGDGVDAIVGLAPMDYQNQFAIQCVKAGFVTLAIEQISFGHRKTQSDRSFGSSCVRDSMAALMLGESMIAWRCFDAMCAYDVLAQHPMVDSERIAIMGISGGGLTAFWTACLDQRFAAAVVSGYFNTFQDSILAVEHCPDNFAFNLSCIVEMPDMAALMAPRNLFVESGTLDTIFPQESFNQACETARQIYDEAGSGTAFSSHLFEDDHVFNGVQAIPKLKEWLGIS